MFNYSNIIINMLALIWCFIFVGLFFIWLNAEFIGFALIIIYGSSISILFLFIIMLFNLRLLDIYYNNYYEFTKERFILNFLFILLFFLFILLFFYFCDLFSLIYLNFLSIDILYEDWLLFIYSFNYINNLFIFGFVLFNFYWHYLLFAGIILLIALFGTIFITNPLIKLTYCSNIYLKKNIQNNYILIYGGDN